MVTILSCCWGLLFRKGLLEATSPDAGHLGLYAASPTHPTGIRNILPTAIPPLFDSPAVCQSAHMKVMEEGFLEAGPLRSADRPSETGTVARLFKTHAHRLGRLLNRRLRNPDDAQDASQEVFLKLWRQERLGQL